MSLHKIGDYIHYRHQNYQKHGISLDGDKGESAISVFEKHETALKRIMDGRSKEGQIKRKLENQLNFFFNPKAMSERLKFNFTPEEIDNLQNAIKEIFAQTVATLNPNINLNDYNIDFTKLTATVKDPNQFAIKGGGSSLVGQGKTGNTWSTTIIDRFEILMKHRNMLKNVDDVATLVKSLDEFESQYNTFISSLKAKPKHQIYKNENATFINELNELLTEVKNQTSSYIQGILGEYIPAITQYVLANKITSVTDDLLESFLGKKTLVGTSGSVQYISPTAFTGGSKQLRQGQGLSFGKDGQVKVRTQVTQDKVDIILDVPNDPGAEKIMASVKNYNLAKKNLTVQSGNRSLLNYIQDYQLFANHYLNMTVQYEKGSRPNAIDVTQAHNLMKLTIAIHSLVGGMQTTSGRQSKAEILIVNDNRTGKFKVYFMRDLINKISQNINLIKISGYNNPKWKNKWVGEKGINNTSSAYARIAEILAQVRSTGITKVVISTAALT